MMYEVDWGMSASGLEMAWVRTADGLRMCWTRERVEQERAVVEMDAVRQTPAVAA